MPRNKTGYNLLGSVFDVEIILVNMDSALIEAKTTERIIIVIVIISWYWYIHFILFICDLLDEFVTQREIAGG